MLLSKKTVKEAWEAIKLMCLGADRVKAVSAQKLLAESEWITFKVGETIEEFAIRITKISTDLSGLGDKSVDEKRVVRKFLRVVPARYNQIAVATEMFCDLDTLSIEELIGRLRAAEERFESAVKKVTEKTDEWTTKRLWKLVSESSSSSSGHKGGKPVCPQGQVWNRGTEDACDYGNGLTSMGTPRRKGRCNKCKVYGHYAKECKTKPNEERKEVAHHAAADGETRALLVA